MSSFWWIFHHWIHQRLSCSVSPLFCTGEGAMCLLSVNTQRPRRNGHFADDIFKSIFFNSNVWFSIRISLKFVPKGPINAIPALVQIMARRRPGDKPLSEPMMVSLLTHIYASLGLNELNRRLFCIQIFSDYPFYSHSSLGRFWCKSSGLLDRRSGS